MRTRLLNNNARVKQLQKASVKKAIEYPETTEFCRPIGSTSYFTKLHLLTI